MLDNTNNNERNLNYQSSAQVSGTSDRLSHQAGRIRNSAHDQVQQSQVIAATSDVSERQVRPTRSRQSGEPKKPGETKRTVLVVLGIIVLAIVIWVLVWLFACNGNSLLDPSAQTGQAPYKSQEEIQAELDRTVAEGMFNISIASVIQFEDGTSQGTAYIENVPGNHYLMQVTITDDDTGDVLYESGVLKPNQFIENITLVKDLDPGTYDATAMFTALDEQTYEEIGHAAAKVTLNVLN